MLLSTTPFYCQLRHTATKNNQPTTEPGQKYILHAVNRNAEIFLAYGNGTLCKAGLGNTRISLQNLMTVTNAPSVSSLVAGEPVSGLIERVVVVVVIGRDRVG